MTRHLFAGWRRGTLRGRGSGRSDDFAILWGRLVIAALSV